MVGAAVTDSVVVTHLADSPAVRDSAARADFLVAGFLVAQITPALMTVVSVDALATFAILMGTLSISASMGSDIRRYYPYDYPITIHTPMTTTVLIKASIFPGTIERLDQVM